MRSGGLSEMKYLVAIVLCAVCVSHSAFGLQPSIQETQSGITVCSFTAIHKVTEIPFAVASLQDSRQNPIGFDFEVEGNRNGKADKVRLEWTGRQFGWRTIYLWRKRSDI